jgi:hypothetical protein
VSEESSCLEPVSLRPKKSLRERGIGGLLEEDFSFVVALYGHIFEGLGTFDEVGGEEGAGAGTQVEELGDCETEFRRGIKETFVRCENVLLSIVRRHNEEST